MAVVRIHHRPAPMIQYPESLNNLKLGRNATLGQLQQLFSQTSQVTLTAADKVDISSLPATAPTPSSLATSAHRITGSGSSQGNQRHRKTGKNVVIVERRRLNKRKKTVPECSVCGKIFKTHLTLKRHMVTHTKERPHSCSICPMTFAQRAGLWVHMITQHSASEKNHECDTCGKRFHFNYELKAHTKRHLGLKSHRCDICRKTFVTRGELIDHQISHSLKKPFCCSLCRKRFKRKISLESHTRKHIGERPYKCVKCQKFYVSSQALHMHLKSKLHLENAAIISSDK